MNILPILLLAFLSFGQKILAPILYGNNASAVSTPWVTGQSLGTAGNTITSGGTGCFGVAFTTSGSPLTVTDLGRWVISGNSQNHVVAIFLQDGTPVVSATVVTSGATAGQYKYTAITPTTLAASTRYVIGSTEVSGGDQWYDNTTTITVTSAATYYLAEGSDIFTTPHACPSQMFDGAGGNTSYGPVNFKYYF